MLESECCTGISEKLSVNLRFSFEEVYHENILRVRVLELTPRAELIQSHIDSDLDESSQDSPLQKCGERALFKRNTYLETEFGNIQKYVYIVSNETQTTHNKYRVTTSADSKVLNYFFCSLVSIVFGKRVLSKGSPRKK